jgi:hypothetical protein
MDMHKLYRFFIVIGLLVALSLACNAPGMEAEATPTNTEAVPDTGEVVPTDTPMDAPVFDEATATPTSTSTPSPSPTPTVTTIPCNRASFVSDVTIPDGTKLEPDEGFTKTWRLKNTGSCTWNSDYDLVFDHGDSMDGPAAQQLTGGSVAPNQNVDVSVNLNAPSDEGDYKGYYKLRDKDGVIFGIGPNADVAFWVDIEVKEPDDPPDLVVEDISFNPYPPVQGQPVQVRVRINNLGGSTGEEYKVSWWGGKNFPSPAKTWTVDGLNAGEVYNLTFTYPGYTSWYSSIETKAVVDVDDDVDESDENNTYLETISVSQP